GRNRVAPGIKQAGIKQAGIKQAGNDPQPATRPSPGSPKRESGESVRHPNSLYVTATVARLFCPRSTFTRCDG
ncbi:MAG: hypothetical protein WD060_00145, partial [Pirellulales bacterium]